MRRNEWILAVVFVSVCGMWVTSDIHKVDITVTALLGSVSLLLTGVLSWEDVKSERAAWDIFIWYGGLLMLGKALNDAQVTTEFARLIGGAFGALGWPALFACALGIYFYAHYAFASITAHILAMYPAVPRTPARQGSAGRPDGLRVRMLCEPRRRTHKLRHHALAYVLRAGLRVAENLVANRLYHFACQHRYLEHDRLRLVAAHRHLVRRVISCHG